MRTDYLTEFRKGDDPLNQMQQLVQEVQKEQKQIDIPERDSLNHQEVHLPDEPEGNVRVHGHWIHPLYARINNMMANNQSPIVIIVGKEGKGKSMTALQLMRTLHDKLNILRGDFDPTEQTLYKVIEFLLFERNSTRKGAMFEEANETLNSNDYQTPMNHAVAGALRTQRKRENLHVFVCPEYKELDPRIREKVDILIDMTGKQYAKVKSYRMKHGKRGNRGLDYNYTEYPDWVVPDVPESLQEKYDAIDNAFKGSYLDELLIKVLNEKIEEMQEQQTAKL
jgi:ABC-type dipeptide/oligopeptide/nickel transport system ATPase component